MRGRRVERRFGWDCHGLPAEVQAEKELGISGHPEITAFGIDKFNEACRTSVLRYTQEWRGLRHPPGALGRLRQRLQDARPRLHGERHVGVQVAVGQGSRSPRASGCSPTAGAARRRSATPRPAWTTSTATVRTRRSRCGSSSRRVSGSWPGRRRRGRCRRTWRSPSAPTSTTPSWSEDGQRYILAESRLGAYEQELARRRRGSARSRAPTWSAAGTSRCSTTSPTPRTRSRCSAGDFVSTEDGTGVVHMAPGFGEDDQIACNAVGIPTICPMDEHGRYTAEVTRLGRRSTCSTPTRRSSAASRTRASWCATTATTTRTRTAGAARSRSSTGRSRRGSSRSPSSATGWSSSTSRSPGCRSTSRTAASASGSRTPATGRSAATGSGAHRSRSGRATTRRTRGSTCTDRSTSCDATSASRSPTSIGRRSTTSCARIPTIRPGGR